MYYRKCKKDYSWNPTTCILIIAICLKIIADISVIPCDEIVSFMDIVSTKNTNTIATYVTKNCHSKKVKYEFDCYILHRVLLAIMLLLIITIICYYYAKQKDIDSLTI